MKKLQQLAIVWNKLAAAAAPTIGVVLMGLKIAHELQTITSSCPI